MTQPNSTAQPSWEINCQVCGRSSLDGLPDEPDGDRCQFCGQSEPAHDAFSRLFLGCSMSKPRLLDLFCGAGGATAGYQDAGFYVVGVDIAPQPNYCGDVFVQADALEVLNDWDLESFDVVHASPPCQDYSKALRHLSNPTPRLIEPVREILEASGKRWVIENVEGAPLPFQHTVCGRYGSMFCGSYFGLRVHRHRLFEANWPIKGTMCRHAGPPLNAYNKKGRAAIEAEFPNEKGIKDWAEVVWRREMGIEWMGRYEGREAIPPVFTKEIGRQLLNGVLEVEAAA